MVTRRRIASLLIALSAGTLITVVIAWAAMFLPYGPQGYMPPVDTELGLTRTSDGHRIWQLDEGRNAWHRVVQYWHMQISGQSLWIPATDFEASRFDLTQLPAHLRPASVDDLHAMAWYHEVGWPRPALACSVHWKTQISNANIIYDVRGGVQLPRDAQFNPRALPLAPIWPGFGIDVLLWSAALLAMMQFFTTIRTRRRRRRNQCVHCGYDHTGLTPDARCPECGWSAARHKT